MNVLIPSLEIDEEPIFKKEDVQVVELIDPTNNKSIWVSVSDHGGFEIRTIMGKLVRESNSSNTLRVHVKDLSEDI